MEKLKITVLGCKNFSLISKKVFFSALIKIAKCMDSLIEILSQCGGNH